MTDSKWPAAYLDVRQGMGVMDGGRRFTCRPNARLAEVLATVDALPVVRRLYLCGELPTLLAAGSSGSGAVPDEAAEVLTGVELTGDADEWDALTPAGGLSNGYLLWALDNLNHVSAWRQDPDRPHHLDTARAASCVLRFRHRESGRQLDVVSVRGWFGDTPCSPDEAREALALLRVRLDAAFQGAVLLGSAGQTGLFLWKRLTERAGKSSPVLPEDVRQLLHVTSGQGRVELFPSPPDQVLPTTPGLPSLYTLDGRWMYVASMRGLGTGPVLHDELPDFEPYRPGRYRVRFTVPQSWRHVGILPVTVEGTRGGWEWPREPGTTSVTWASEREVQLACWPFPCACQGCAWGYAHGGLPCHEHGWGTQIVERLLFAAGQDPLRTWQQQLVGIRDEVQRAGVSGRIPPHVSHLVMAALRSMLLNALGSFYQRRHLVTRSAALGTGDHIPPGVRDLHIPPSSHSSHGIHGPCDAKQSYGFQGAYLWTEVHQQPADDFTHPEWPTQVWGRCRGRLLLARYETGGSVFTGMLTQPPEQIVAARTDALYLTADPAWPDDGRAGRLRLKSALSCAPHAPYASCAPGAPSEVPDMHALRWPRNWAELAALKEAMRDVSPPPTCCSLPQPSQLSRRTKQRTCQTGDGRAAS